MLEREQDILPPNRLVKETSPYLLAHAHNPVDWFPWGEDAFAKAKAENKLVLVSIGYSSCHWCHVMERECFVDGTIARLMNAHYVCIKVDREERPDVDQVYMAAVQLMTGRGGWPLNCFALPDARPIYGGTYFPPPQWTRVLTDLAATWEREPERVRKQAAQLQQGVRESMLVAPVEGNTAPARALEQMVGTWEKDFDTVYGGPDKVPKFPMPNNYEFLLRYGHITGRRELLHHLELTLDRMALGGIFDQVGGGFARYSTDALWKVPHFEKMLYDNAQLVSLYSQAFQSMRKTLYRETVERTIGFIEREMTSKEGAFFSAIDADSEGEEGRYYVWTKDELEEALGPDLELACAYFDIGGQALWEHDRNILRRGMHDAEFARVVGLDLNALVDRLAIMRTKLLAARSQRVRPMTDEKALVSWNALMAKALCDAYEVFGEKRWLELAERNMDLMLERCAQANGGLWHSYKDGKAHINGYLEDYAMMIEALVTLYGITFDEQRLRMAQGLAEHAIRHFLDESTGFFHFTSNLDPPLMARPMEIHDNVMPASNSVMATALHHLGILLDIDRYKQLSARMLGAMLPRIQAYPTGHSNWAQLALSHAYCYYEIALTGPGAMELREGFRDHYVPNRIFLGCTSTSDLPLLKHRMLPGNLVHVCMEGSCRLPVPTVAEALSQIKWNEKS
jgi:uncharacterized protein